MKIKEQKIVVNKAQCNMCKDIIESTHTHDFKWCSCGSIAVDGGNDYLRRTWTRVDDIIELSEYKEITRTIAPGMEDWYRENEPDKIIEG